MSSDGATQNVVVVDQTAIYNILLEVRDDVRDVKKDVGELKKDSEDHEGRIRTLERKVWFAAGIAAAIGILGGAGMSQIASALGA